ncbi:MAG: tRNA adenosine(34) deaminase TadA [Oscillospiraceae bacterium]|nr:tRNA adenosine(34) deaminase TadA [Oscillospiraceae bacterium]
MKGRAYGGCRPGPAERYMDLALREAGKAALKGEVPVGAVIVRDGAVLAKGRNKRMAGRDVAGHAEIDAMRKAARKLGDWRLDGCEMYVTLEPCPMCAGAIIQSRLARLHYGASDPKAGAAGSVVDLFAVDGWNHRVEVMEGVMGAECSAILSAFFRGLRKGVGSRAP